MVMEIGQLGKVRWTPSGVESTLLKELHYEHSFGGVNARPPEGFFMARQTHGTTVIGIDAADRHHHRRGSVSFDAKGLPEADAQVTTVRGQVVAVRTADCLPVLIGDRRRRQVAAVHGGWRGLTGGILRETLEVFGDQGISPADLVAVLGPAISRESYEVGPDVVEAVFGQAFGLGERAALITLAKGIHDRWHFDLAVAAALHLVQLGMDPQSVEVINACTYKEKAWNSFRRDRQTSSLNWSWIRL